MANIIKLKRIKSLKDNEVKEYLNWAVTCKSFTTIRDELNAIMDPKSKKLTIDEICRYYVSLKRTSSLYETLLKEELIEMTKSYLENTTMPNRSRGNAWLVENAYEIVEELFELKEQTAWKLSVKIFKDYMKIISGDKLIKHFRRVGIDLPSGNRELALEEGGKFYAEQIRKHEKNKEEEI